MMLTSNQAGPDASHRELTVCGGTDIGSIRQQNQDTFVILNLESGSTSRPSWARAISAR